LASLATAGALLAGTLPSQTLDWQPALAWSQPWRWWSAAFVHWSALHLAANLAGVAVVAALGWAAAVPPRVAVAWAAAWPLTHLALLTQPALLHYGGLSGLLHAGVACAAVWLLWSGRGMRRAIGGAIAVGLAAKIVAEAPWAHPLLHPTGWDIAVAPLAHASGALSGALCTLAALTTLRAPR
jgi:rhomboid family GlyGly-CTERM serine protease